MGAHFQVSPPSAATIRNDYRVIGEQKKEEVSEYADLLHPDRFDEFRNTFFKAPGGSEYHTPRYQQAWQWMIWALTFKTRIPDWVLDLLEYPHELNEDLLGGEKLMSVINLAPPRHGKTETGLHGIIQILCKDPSKRIIYCSGISTTSADNMSLIMQEFETNEKLIEAFGPFKADDKQWSYKNGFHLAKSPPKKTTNIHPIGVRSNILSKDADLIFVDDPQDLDAAESEATTTRDYKWLTTNLMTRREPHTPVIGFGSHQPSTVGDVWSLIEENIGDLNTGSQRIYMTKMKAHDVEVCGGDPHESCVLWPEVRPYWYLEALRAALGDEMFEVCFNQDARMGKVTFFDVDRIRGDYVYPERKDGMIPLTSPYLGGILDRSRGLRVGDERCCNPGQQLLYALGVDPAASESRRASKTACVMLAACRTCKRRYLVDYTDVRQSPEKHPDLILQFVQAYRPQRVRIEKNAYQAALARDPRLTQRRAEFGFAIDEWQTDDRKNDPSMGIPTINYMIEEGRLSVPYRDPHDQEAVEEFLRSLIRWPKTPNDIPMALWLAELSIRELIKEAEWTTPLVFAGWDGQMEDPLPEASINEYYEVDMADVLEIAPLDIW